MRIQGDKLRRVREQKVLSLWQVSEKSGIAEPVLQRFEAAAYSECRGKTIHALAEALDCGIDDIIDMTSSHGEREIYDGCIALMRELTEEFREWLEWQGIDVRGEERFEAIFPCTHIVERLFLWNTNHSGGTSCGLKLKELGIEKYGERFGDFAHESAGDKEES